MVAMTLLVDSSNRNVAVITPNITHIVQTHASGAVPEKTFIYLIGVKDPIEVPRPYSEVMALVYGSINRNR